MGQVWKARDTILDRTVALKIPRREQSRAENYAIGDRVLRPAMVGVAKGGGAVLPDLLSGRVPLQTIRDAASGATTMSPRPSGTGCCSSLSAM